MKLEGINFRPGLPGRQIAPSDFRPGLPGRQIAPSDFRPKIAPSDFGFKEPL